MRKRPRPIQPLPPGGIDKRSSLEPPKPQKRTVVCNRCREKRTACDRKRPSCQKCTDLGVECIYVSDDPSKTLKQSLKDQISRLEKTLKEHEDILDHLRSEPADEAVAMVRRLGSTKNASEVLSTLKGSAHSAYRPSQRTTERGLLPITSSNIEFELCRLHDAVYPPLVHIDLNAANLGDMFNTRPGDAQSAYSFEPKSLDLSLPDVSESKGDSPTIQIDSPAAVRGTPARRHSPIIGPLMTRTYCDPRLQSLKIKYWTAIPIDDEFAACALSLHFETYHAFLGFVDFDLFITDLVEHKLNYCSAFLFSALMSLACQDYNTFDIRSSAFSTAFYRETMRLWKAERTRDSASTLAALCYLAVSCIWSGRDEVGMQVMDDVRSMAPRMKLYDIRPTQQLKNSFIEMSPENIKALSHIAWGSYGWSVIYSSWYPLASIEFPPLLPIPGDSNRQVEATNSKTTWPTHPLPAFVGETFVALRRFYVIVQEINMVYGPNHKSPAVERVSLAFAESKYQLLLSWADSLSTDMRCGKHSSSHVFVFHLLYHSTIITLFLPFLEDYKDQRLRSFYSADSSPGTIFAASLNQLKNLLYIYRVEYPDYRSINSFLNVPLLHVLPALITTSDPDRRFYTRLVGRFWRDLYTRYRIVKPMLQANLTMALEHGILTTFEAGVMMDELTVHEHLHSVDEEQIAKCLINLKQVMGGHEIEDEVISAIAQRFEGLMVFERFTHSVSEIVDDDSLGAESAT